MIDVKNAIQEIVESQIVTEIITVPVKESLGYVLAKEVRSPIAMPPFNQSAMDGYALSGEFDRYQVTGEIKAGDTNVQVVLKPGEAVRIFTGAMLPEGGTAIAKQEIVEREGNKILLTEQVSNGTSIRRKGEEIEMGQVALSKDTVITAAAIGFLTGVGVQEVQVFKKPSIGVVVTGNELVKPGAVLLQGEIYESNSFSLQAALAYSGFDSSISSVKDDYEVTQHLLLETLNKYDVMIITGGISVGDYDFVGKALGEIGVKEVFYKVNQKPGKPLFYGIFGSKKIFGLPGNPAAALTCFYMYVLPAIKKMMGFLDPVLEIRSLPLKHDYHKKGNRAYLLKGKVDQLGVEIHSGQSSAMLSSFVEANCIVYIENDRSRLTKGDLVDVYMLPNR